MMLGRELDDKFKQGALALTRQLGAVVSQSARDIGAAEPEGQCPSELARLKEKRDSCTIRQRPSSGYRTVVSETSTLSQRPPCATDVSLLKTSRAAGSIPS